LRKGEKKFFLNPGEELEKNKINDVIVLGEDEALLLKATSYFKDEDGKKY
jgi:major vault protein